MSRMTKLAAVIIVIALISLSTCATTGSGTGGLSLQDAIEQTGAKIAGELPKGSRVAIVAFESVNDNLSDYVMEELTGALFDRGIEVADRQNLEYVYKELNLQMSGDVSDDSAKSIGKFLAADMVITGQLLDLDGTYRYRTSAINVETAVRASVTRLDVRSDNATRRMITALASQQTTVKAAKYGVSENSTPQTAGAFLDRGIMFASRGVYNMAIEDFDEAIRINPGMFAAYMLRARALVASVSTVTAIGDNFSSISTVRTIGGASAEQVRVYDRAIVDYTSAIRFDPSNVGAYSERGRAYSYKGDPDRAIEDYTYAIRLDPNNTAAYNNRAAAYHYRGDMDKAIADYEQVLRLDPANTSAYLGRGFLYVDTGNYDRAITDFNQVLRLNPNSADAYTNRGGTYFYKGDYDRAIADFTEAIRLNPNYADAYANRGSIYNAKGDYSSAIADCEAALRINPNHTNAKRALDIARQRRQFGR